MSEEYLLLLKLSKAKKIWFYDYFGQLHEGFIDEIVFKPFHGWTISMHYKPEHEARDVYTARVWTYLIEEYGKKFALTKKELKNETKNR